MRKKVSAIIIASGAGTRLGEITANTPKPLLEFGGKPYLGYLIDWLLGSGIDSIMVTTYTYADQIERFIFDAYREQPVSTVRELSLKSTVQSARYGLERTRNPHTLLLTADNLWEVSLGDFIACHMQSDADATVMVTGNPAVPNPGKVRVAQHSNVIEQMWPVQGENARRPTRPASTMGMYAVRRDALLGVALPGDTSIEREPMNRLADVRAYWNEGFFFDYGTPENYARLRENPGLINTYMQV